MQDSKNTIAGWVLAGGICALGLSIVSGKVFHADKPERPEKLGYVIEGVVSSEGEGGAAEVPIETLLASADPAKFEVTGIQNCQKSPNCQQGLDSMRTTGPMALLMKEFL